MAHYLYRNSYKEAVKNDEIKYWRLSYADNVACASFLDEKVAQAFDTASDDDKWANMYADYNTATCELKLSIHVSDSEKTEVIEYTPTDAERKLIIAMMEEKCESIYGCSLKEMCAEYIDDTMELGGMA